MVEEEQFYPPEEMFREEFVKSVEEAEKGIKEGKSKRYSYDEFKKRVFSGGIKQNFVGDVMNLPYDIELGDKSHLWDK